MRKSTDEWQECHKKTTFGDSPCKLIFEFHTNLFQKLVTKKTKKSFFFLKIRLFVDRDLLFNRPLKLSSYIKRNQNFVLTEKLRVLTLLLWCKKTVPVLPYRQKLQFSMQENFFEIVFFLVKKSFCKEKRNKNLPQSWFFCHTIFMVLNFVTSIFNKK